MPLNTRAFGPANVLSDAEVRKLATNIVEPSIQPGQVPPGTEYKLWIAVDSDGIVIEQIHEDGPSELEYAGMRWDNGTSVRSWRTVNRVPIVRKSFSSSSQCSHEVLGPTSSARSTKRLRRHSAPRACAADCWASARGPSGLLANCAAFQLSSFAHPAMVATRQAPATHCSMP